MFNGLINFLTKILNFKYHKISNFIFIKINKKFLDLNIGDSISIEGICLTLIYKNVYFFEFDFSYNTFININVYGNKLLNFEKSLNFINNFDGYFLYGHNNNIYIIKNKFLFHNILKLYLISNLDYEKFLIYKSSLSVNGVSLTINELIKFENFILISLNILKYTYYFTNIKIFKLIKKLNIEFDLSILFLLKNIY